MAVLTFPTRGPQKCWDLTEEKHSELLILFPGVDLALEYQTMLAWIEKNGPKSARGMNLFVLNWLKRARKAQSDTYSWNHDRLQPAAPPKNGDSPAMDRRRALYVEELATGKPDHEARASSYRRWKEEGF